MNIYLNFKCVYICLFTCTRTIDAARLSLPYFRFLITGCSTAHKQNEGQHKHTHWKLPKKDNMCRKFLNFTAEIRLLTSNQGETDALYLLTNLCVHINHYF